MPISWRLSIPRKVKGTTSLRKMVKAYLRLTIPIFLMRNPKPNLRNYVVTDSRTVISIISVLRLKYGP